MNVPISYDLHVFAFMILILFSIIIINKNDKNDLRRRLMLILFFLNMILLVLEALTYLVNGNDSAETFYFLNYVSNFFLLFFIPFFTMVWALYIDYIVFESPQRIRSRLFYLIPVIAIFILLLINIFFPFIYSVDQQNVFHKEPFHWVILVILLAIFVQVFIMVAKNRSRIKTSIIWAILSFGIYPVIFELSEFFVGELPFTFISITFGLCSNYLIIETFSSNRDNLTGLYTRSKATNNIRQSIKRHVPLSLVLIDLDDFKYINDTYGHLIGDGAIIEFSKSMVSNLGKQCTISRIGGDEFLIVGTGCSDEAIKEKMEILRKNLQEGRQPYSKHLDFSYGIANYDGEAPADEEALIQIADQRMYENKSEKKKSS